MTEKDFFQKIASGAYRETSETGSGDTAGAAAVDSRGRPIGHTGLRYGGDSYNDKQTQSFRNYLQNKEKYGSSSEWYKAAQEEEKTQSDFVKELEKQINYRKQNEWASSIGGGIDELYGVRDTGSEGVKSVAELEKELEEAKVKLNNATENLKYATAWKDYDADMAWLDNVKQNGQKWEDLSPLLGQMSEATQRVYDKKLQQIIEAQRQNARIDQMKRQGGIPPEVGFKETSAEQLAQWQAELNELAELRDMASRRYGYSLDELGKNSQMLERGALRAEHVRRMAEQNSQKAKEEYAANHIKGDTMGGVREVRSKDKTSFMPADTWSEQQLNRYYVILDNEGEYAAEQYAVKVNTQNNLEAREEAVQGWYDFGYAAGEKGIGRGLVGTAATVLAAPSAMESYLEKAQSVWATGVYTGDARVRLTDKAQALVQGRADRLNEYGTVGEKGLGDLYQLTNSMAQSLAYGNTVGTAGTLALFFGQAANQGFDEAMSRGATGEQAVAFGALSGAAEAMAELIPMENLLNSNASLSRGFLKSALIQAGLEGIEEGETDILNTIADRLVLKDKSAIKSAIAERVEQGESYESAARAEWTNYAKGVIWDIVSGAASGAGASAIQYGKTMISPYKADENGLYRYGASAAQLGAEAAAAEGDRGLKKLGEKVIKKTAQTKENGEAKTISNYTAQKLVKGTNRAAIVDAVERQIKSREEEISPNNARMLANAIVSQSRGEKITSGYKRLLDKHSDLSQSLLQELGTKESGPDKKAGWAQTIGVRGEESQKYGSKNPAQLRQTLAEEEKKSGTKKPSVRDYTEEAIGEKISIPTAKGEVSGVIEGMSLENRMPKYIIKTDEGKRAYVDVYEAIESGKLPEHVAALAYDALGLGEHATAVYNLYKEGQDVGEYVSSMEEAIKLAEDINKRSAFEKSDSVKNLSKEQRDYAWQQGQNKREIRSATAKGEKTQAKEKKRAESFTVSYGGAEFDGHKFKATSKDKIKAADLRVIERLAKAAKVNVVFYESESIDGLYQGANGFYHDGTIYLDVHAGATKTTQQDAVLLTAAHELTHHIRANAAAEYDRLKAFIIEHMLDGEHDFDVRVQEKRKSRDMSREDAVEEVIADACEMVLKDSKAIEKLAAQDKGLLETIADWLHDFYEDIKAAFEGVEARSKEAQAMTDYMDKLVKLWDEALIEASKGESKNSGKAKASYAGRKSRTADMSLYQQALDMEKSGKSSEDIRKKTGWFKGADGEWRYEINDADMQFSRKGFFTNPDVLRFRELDSKFINGEITDKEFEELRALSENLKGVRKTPKYLKDYIKHDELFKAYPELEDVELKFKNLENENGHYDYNNGEIVLDGRLRNNEEQLKDTLIHEIQHAIQHIEGFANGASPAYWQKRIDNGLGGEMRAADRKKAAARVEKFWDSAPNKLKEQLREREVAKAAEDWGKVFEIEAEIYDSENAELFSQMEDADFDLWSVEERDYELDAKDLYRRTAGEVEARDTASRRKMNAEQRKNTRPDIDREDVVFAGDSAVNLSISNTRNMSWQEQISKYLKGQLKTSDALYGGTSEEFISPVTPSPLYLPTSVINKALRKPKGSKSGHSLSEKDIKTFYEGLKNSVAIIYNPKRNSLVYITNNTDDVGQQIVATFDLNNNLYGENAHRATSIHQRASIIPMLESLNEEAIIYVKNKNKFDNLTGLQSDKSPELLAKIELVGARISQDDAKVNYSRRDSSEGLTKEEARAQAQAYTRLKAENAELQHKLEYWKGQTKATKQRTVRKTDVDKYARELVQKHDSKIDRGWLRQKIQELGDYLMQTEAPDNNKLRSLAWQIATEVITRAEVEAESGWDADTRENILADIREKRMYLDPKMREDLPEGFRKKYSGKLHISFDKGRGADSVYAELQDEYGKELFPDMPTPADMLVMMAEAYDTLTAAPKVYNPYRSNMNEAISSVQNDILNQLMSGKIRETAPTVKDRADRDVDRAVQEGRENVSRLRADKNARIEQIKRQEAARRREAVAKEKAEKWAKKKAVEKHYQGMIKRERETRMENAAVQKHRASVYQKIDTLSRLLIKNSNKEHVPEALKEPIAEMLTSLDTSSRRLLKKGEATKKDMSYAEKMTELKNILGKQRAYMQDPKTAEGLDVFLDLPDGFAESVEEHIEAVKAIAANHKGAAEEGPIAYMNSTQLQALDFILTVLERSISQINEFHEKGRYATVDEGARASIMYMGEQGERNERYKAAETAEKMLMWGNALPVYAFKRFGEAGTDRFNALAKGWETMAKNAERAINFAKETYSSEEAREWEESIEEIKLVSGQTVKMSQAQIMGLYCSFRREQARQHLLAGGMRVGRIETGGKSVEQAKAYRLTHDDIINITSTLTDKQIEVANRLQEFLNTVCADWGNAVSMARFGYRQFTESMYYPITTDPNNHPASDPQAKETDIFRLLNLSMTKALNPKANNSIVIFSIFDVFSAHTADMAKYNGLALPVLDLLKWYNYKDTRRNDVTDSQGNVTTQLQADSVQASVERAYGKPAQEYVINFLKDLNGKREGGRGEGVLKGFMSRYKTAAVAMNARVVIQQPTSIVRATYLLNPKYLMQGAKEKGGTEEAKQYSGLAVWKSLGFFDTNLAKGMQDQIKNSDSFTDKAVEKGMAAAGKADEITFGIIWNACKLEQMDKTDLSGEELMQATNDRFREVILSTQVIDSTISRSDWMRSDSLAMKELTSFKSEPTVSYNMLLESVTEFEAERRRTGSIKEARRYAWPIMGRASLVFVSSQFATAAAAAIIDALRDDDEYQNYVEKWLEHLWSNFKDGLNPLSLLPVIGDAVNVALGKETKQSMLFEPAAQLPKAWTAMQDLWRTWFNSDKELNDPNRTNWGRLYQIAQAASSLSGLPVAGFMRELKTVWNISGRLITGKRLKTYDSGVKNNIKYALQDKYITEEEAIALLVESGEYSDPDDAYWKVQEWKHAEDSEWSRYNEVYNAVLAGDMEAFERAVDELGDHGISAHSVRTNLKTQIGRWFVGGEDVRQHMDEKTAVKALQDFAGVLPVSAQNYINQLKFEKKYGVRWADMKAEYMAGHLTAEEVKAAKLNYGHETAADIAAELKEWEFEKTTGIAYANINEAYVNEDITKSQYAEYQKRYGNLSQSAIDEKLLELEVVKKYGIKLGSTTDGIKANLIAGNISEAVAREIMQVYDGKTEREAYAYTKQYLFTAETGYSWSDSYGVMEAYADGVIDDDEAREWFKGGLANGTDDVAEEYLQVAQWRRDVPGAEKMNREGVQKWNKYGKNTSKVGLGKEDFAEAWAIYSAASSQYDSEGNVVKEKKELVFESLYELYRNGTYTLKEIDGLARSLYASSTVNKYAPW